MNNVPCLGRVAEQLRLWHTVGGSVSQHSHFGTLTASTKAEQLQPVTQQYYSEVCMQHQCVHLFTKRCELECSQQHYLYEPWTGNNHISPPRMDKCSPTMDYSTTMKMNNLYTRTWTNLTNIMLNERKQIQKKVYHMNPFICSSHPSKLFLSS